MARLLSWKPKVAVLSLIDGPASFGSGSNTLVTGQEQTFASATYALSFDLSFPPSREAQARAEYGWLLAMHNGANATRYDYRDSQAKRPIDVGQTHEVWQEDVIWEDVEWVVGHGTVALGQDAAKGATVILLSNEKWGYDLEFGDQISFGPSYYGAHWITEVFNNGTYRIVPPLRSALQASAHRANLEPRLALRFIPGNVNYGSLNPAYAAERGGRLVEVFDEYVTTYFGD